MTDSPDLIQNSRGRLLEMIRRVEAKDPCWKVLIMDGFTLKTVSYLFKSSQVHEQHIFAFESLYKARQPFPSLNAIYFMQPTEKNVNVFLSDMAGQSPLYKKAFLFFSSRLSEELLNRIKGCATLTDRLSDCAELNLEFWAVDSLGFITNNEHALEELYENEEDTHKGAVCLNAMAARIATVFVSLKEFPSVRYRAAKSLNATTITTFRDLIPTKLAAAVFDCLVKYKDTNPDFFPRTETCELLILDRSVDQITPVMHEWTYDAMCYDLLNLEGKKYIHMVPSKSGGPTKEEEVLLEDDPVWFELRHAHIADVYQQLHEKMDSCVNTMPAQIERGSRGDTELSIPKLSKLVGALQNYIYQKEKLGLHIEIAGELNRIVKKFGLRELGQLEQDLVFGDAGIEDVIKYLESKDDTTCEHKLRLLMILAAIYPEVFEGEKGYGLMKLAKLQPGDMNAVNNVRLLGGYYSDARKSSIHEKKRAVRKKHVTEEETWQFSHFYPIIEELVEKLSKGELSEEDYPCIRQPVSRRSRRPPTWAPQAGQQANDYRYSRDECSNFPKARRIFVFIAGGATRSELRACHKLTTKLKRQVILGSSSLDDPAAFVSKMKLLKVREDGY